jgi:hypothetical protein
MRLRAIHIREAALGFADDVSKTLLGLAEDLEAEATKMEQATGEGSETDQPK